MAIFTIGHSNHPMERFLELLAKHEIQLIADVRRFPGSRKHPQFNRAKLQTSLGAQHIEYEWIEELGGRRPAAKGVVSQNLALHNESFRNYADYMSTAPFQQGIDKLLTLANHRTVATMCAEGLWWQCHRRLISDFLVANGQAVLHILPDGKTTPHSLMPEARTSAGRVTYPAPKTLFDVDASDTEARK